MLPNLFGGKHSMLYLFKGRPTVLNNPLVLKKFIIVRYSSELYHLWDERVAK